MMIKLSSSTNEDYTYMAAEAENSESISSSSSEQSERLEEHKAARDKRSNSNPKSSTQLCSKTILQSKAQVISKPP